MLFPWIHYSGCVFLLSSLFCLGLIILYWIRRLQRWLVFLAEFWIELNGGSVIFSFSVFSFFLRPSSEIVPDSGYVIEPIWFSMVKWWGPSWSVSKDWSHCSCVTCSLWKILQLVPTQKSPWLRIWGAGYFSLWINCYSKDENLDSDGRNW